MVAPRDGTAINTTVPQHRTVPLATLPPPAHPAGLALLGSLDRQESRDPLAGPVSLVPLVPLVLLARPGPLAHPPPLPRPTQRLTQRGKCSLRTLNLLHTSQNHFWI
jgi:hypothetical protein